MEWPDELRLVFLPGLDGTGLSYQPFGEEMPPNARATVVTYPGDKPLSFAQHVDWAAQQIPRDKPVVILAESFSGPVAIRLLNSISLDARAAVFCATFARSPRPLLLKLGKVLPLYLAFRLPIPAIVYRWFCGDPEAATRLVPMFRQMRRMTKRSVIAHRLRLLADLDVTPDLAKLRLPCLYIQASHDSLVPSRCLEPFRRALPQLRVARVTGPHVILQARPKECAKIVTEFAKETGA